MGIINLRIFFSANMYNRLVLNSLKLLFRLPFRGAVKKIYILFYSQYHESFKCMIELAVHLAAFLEFRSLVPQCNIMWFGLRSRKDGFT